MKEQVMADDSKHAEISEGAALIPYEWAGSYFFGEEELDALTDVFRARSPFRLYGHNLKRYADRLEQSYCERLGRKYALTVNSGTAALSVAMAALSIGPGDEVLVPGYMWVSCLSAIVRAGAIPRLVDVDDTFCMDPNDLEKKVGPHTRAVLLVHMSGASGAVDTIAEFCRKRGLYLVEDSAQANGGRFRGKPLGSFGDAAIFSFQLNKIITAGEGGMFVCDDSHLYRRAWACHDLGYPRTPEGRLDNSDPDCQLWGQGSRFPEFLAAVVYAQFPKLDRITSEMRRKKYALREKLSKIKGLAFRRIIDPDGDNGAFLIMNWKDRDTCLRVVEKTRQAGILTGSWGLNNVPMTGWGLHIYYNNPSLVLKRSLSAAGRPWTDPLNAFAANYEYAKGSLPVLDALIDRSSLLAIPPVLSDEAIEKIASAFEQATLEVDRAAARKTGAE
jgi:dTDP-4-amino-4,6-dideoxygalactose transaminase